MVLCWLSWRWRVTLIWEEKVKTRILSLFILPPRKFKNKISKHCHLTLLSSMSTATHSSLAQSGFITPHVTSAFTRLRPGSVVKNGHSTIQSGLTLLPQCIDLKRRLKTTLSHPDLWTQASSNPLSMRCTDTTLQSKKLNGMVSLCSLSSAKGVRIVIFASDKVSCPCTKAKFLSKFLRANSTLWKS